MTNSNLSLLICVLCRIVHNSESIKSKSWIKWACAVKDESCEEPRLGLNQINDATDRRRVPLQDEDHLENDPHLVPGFPRLCSGMIAERFRVRPYLRVQEKFVKFRQSAQNAGLCPAELLDQFFSDSAFNLLRNLCDIFLINSRNGRVS